MLDLELGHIAKAVDGTLDELWVLKSFDALLENKVTELALNDLMKVWRVTKFLADLCLNIFWSSINANFYELRGKFVLR